MVDYLKHKQALAAFFRVLEGAAKIHGKASVADYAKAAKAYKGVCKRHGLRPNMPLIRNIWLNPR